MKKVILLLAVAIGAFGAQAETPVIMNPEVEIVKDRFATPVASMMSTHAVIGYDLDLTLYDDGSFLFTGNGVTGARVAYMTKPQVGRIMDIVLKIPERKKLKEPKIKRGEPVCLGQSITTFMAYANFYYENGSKIIKTYNIDCTTSQFGKYSAARKRADTIANLMERVMKIALDKYPIPAPGE